MRLAKIFLLFLTIVVGILVPFSYEATIILRFYEPVMLLGSGARALYLMLAILPVGWFIYGLGHRIVWVPIGALALIFTGWLLANILVPYG